MSRLPLLGTLIAGALLIGGSIPANSEGAGDPFGDVPPLPKLSSREDLPDPANGQSLSEVADRIAELGRETGFAGQAVDPYETSIRVWWVGDPPQRVREYVDSKPNGVAVSIKTTATYTRQELLEASAKLINSSAAKELKIYGVSGRFDGVGLEVWVTGDTGATLTRVDELSDAAGARVVAVTGGKPPELAATRLNDSPPWSAGGRAISMYGGPSVNPVCSVGFAVLSGGQGRLLTSRHCDPGGNAELRDGGGQTIAPAGGNWIIGSTYQDTQLVDPISSPATRPHVYRGARSSGTTSLVKNWYSNWPDDVVCQSGASTGERCGRVINDNFTLHHPDLPQPVLTIIAAGPTPSSPMVGGGDSGGPVFRPISGGVQARGITTAKDAPVPCTGEYYGGLWNCGNLVYYTPISTLMNYWGVSLEVG